MYTMFASRTAARQEVRIMGHFANYSPLTVMLFYLKESQCRHFSKSGVIRRTSRSSERVSLSRIENKGLSDEENTLSFNNKLLFQFAQGRHIFQRRRVSVTTQRQPSRKRHGSITLKNIITVIIRIIYNTVSLVVYNQ